MVGAGYVGLVTGVGLARMGHQVICVDVDDARVSNLNRGHAPFFEEGIEDLLREQLGNGFAATSDLADAVDRSDLTMLAVGTPFVEGQIDLSAVLGATRQIGAALRVKRDYHVVVVKSTVVPGTTEQRVLPQLERTSGLRAGVDFGLGMNPEFLSEGDAVRDFFNPDRIVLGGIDSRSIDAMANLYEGFETNVPRIVTTPRTAEMIKYASNALLATLISFANEIADAGSAVGAIDATQVMRAVHLSQYFHAGQEPGPPPIVSFLQPGCGFGGSCLPKDLRALVSHARSLGTPTPLLEAVLDINSRRASEVVRLVRKHYPSLERLRVAILGLAFKPGTSDVRESPALPIIRELHMHGAIVKAHDPVAIGEAAKAFGADVATYCATIDDALADVDVAVLVTSWQQYKDLPDRLSERDVLLVDGRRMFAPGSFRRYEGVGL
jgi:UDPglucose 6-dehydrogenase/GDP-mannose 6-dehydrogenase